MKKPILQLAHLAVAAVAAAALAGCGLATSTSEAISPTGPQVAAMNGMAHGGQQPLVGSIIKMYAVSTSGYNTAAYDMQPKDNSGNTPATDSNGNFFVHTYTCSSPCTSNSEVYMLAVGGDPGAGNNSAVILFSTLGAVSSLSSIQFVWMNEVTTAAAAYAVAPFVGSDLYHVSTSSSNTAGLANAFTVAQNLANISTGQAGGPSLPSGAVVSSDVLNGIADILAACINSTGPGSATCSNLFSYTGGSDVFTAAVTMARNPGTKVSQIWDLLPSQPVFGTALTGAPNDLTLSITYNGGSMNKPASPVVDASGNVWVANTGASTVTKLTPSGVATSTTVSSPPNALALDPSGNAWVAAGSSSGNSALIEVSSAGSVATTCTGNGLNVPTGISLDSSNDLWLTNSGNNTLSAFTSGCSGTSGALGNYSGGGLSAPIGIVSANQ